MEKLNYCETVLLPYTHVTTFLAPEGAFYFSGDYLFPVMYVSVWKDPDGYMHNIPMWEEEMNDLRANGEKIQPYIEELINENRQMRRCMTCDDFIHFCKGENSDGISAFMEDCVDSVIRGDIKTTPELREDFKNGVWGDLRTLKNDGSLGQGWAEELNEEGALNK
jgi:hypothetical protein